MGKEKELNQPSTMLFSKQTPAAGGTAFAQFDAAWCYDGNGYIFNDTGTSLDVRIGATGSVQTLAAGGTLPIKLVYSMAELYVRRTDQSTTQVTVEAQVGTGSAGGGGSTADMGVIAAAATAAHNGDAAAHVKLPMCGGPIIWTKQGIWQVGATGRTITQQWHTLRPYHGVRFVFINYGASPFTVGPLNVAACPSSFLAGNSAALSGRWTLGKFGGNATGVIPAQAGAVPGMLVSDIVPVVSTPRSDGVGYITQSRVWLPGGVEYLRTPVGGTYTLNARFGTVFGTGYEADADGSLALTPSATAPGSLNESVSWAIVGIQYYGDHGRTLIAFGDSTVAGSGSTGATLSDSTLVTFGSSGWTVQNLGVAGRTSVDNYAQIKAYVTANKPAVIRFHLFSPNDGTATLTAFRTAYIGGVDVIEHCRKNGTLPIICTALPNSAVDSDPSRKPWWLEHNDAVRDLAAQSSVLLIDYAKILTGSATATAWISGLSADGTHPSDAGYAKIAEATEAVLASIA